MWFVSEECIFLAASPDGYIGRDHIVEVKCPYHTYGSKIVANKSSHFLAEHCDNHQLHLKESSKCFMQVQGQCGVTAWSYATLFVEEINFDKEYWITFIVPQLQFFYEKHLRSFTAKSLQKCQFCMAVSRSVWICRHCITHTFELIF